MKRKKYTKLLITAIVCAIVTSLLMIIIPIQRSEGLKSQRVINGINSDREINDAEGYGYIVNGLASATYDTVNIITSIVFVFAIPMFLLFIIVVSQTIARLAQIGVEQKSKNITSKVLTYISIIAQILLSINWITYLYLIRLTRGSKSLILFNLVMDIVVIYIFISTIRTIDKQN